MSWAGLVTWLCTALPLAWVAAGDPAVLAQPRVLVWFVAFGVFGAGLFAGLRGSDDGKSLRWFAPQLVAAITAVVALPFSAFGIPANVLLFVILAASLPLAGFSRAGYALIALQSAVIWLVYRERFTDLPSLWVFIASIGGFQLFTHASATLVRREFESRRELSLTLDELQATRGVVASSSRLTERIRIARELHDSLGHQLTALSVHLELAKHQPAPESKESIETARSLCRLLLVDLRDVLADIRSTDAGELADSIREVLAHVPTPRSVLTVEGELGCIDPVIAHELLRCVQELSTNAMRHSNARTLELRLQRVGGNLILVAHDDGRGLPAVLKGTGIRGMRERVEALGGRFEQASGEDREGLRTQITVPLSKDVA